MSGSFITGAHASWGLEFSTGNSAVARRVLVYLKKDFGFMPSTMVRQGRRLRKRMSTPSSYSRRKKASIS